MEFLIGLGAFIQAVPDRAHIANDQLLDALPVQRVDQIAGKFVLDVLDLVLELTQPLLLGADQFPAPLASLLAAGNLRVHPGDELVAVLSLAAQQAPIEQVNALPIVGNRRMHLTQVDARAVFRSPFLRGQLLFLRQAFPDLIGRDGFVLAPRPVDDDSLRKIPLPEQDQRGVLTTIGEDEQRVFECDGAGFVLNAEIPLAVARGTGGGVRLASFSPAGKPCKERLDGCIHGVGMQQLLRVGRDEPHEIAWA